MKSAFYQILSSMALFALAFGLVGCMPKKPEPTDQWEKIEERGYLMVGATYNFPPQGYLDKNGKPIGFEQDLIHLIAKELLGDETKVRTTPATNTSWQIMVNSGQADFLLSSMVKTETWAPYYIYGQPYFDSVFRIVVREGEGIKSVNDLKHKKVTFLFGGTSEGVLKKATPPETQLIGFNTVKDELDAFKNGQVDAFAQQESVLYHLLKEQCGLQFLPEKLAPQPFRILYAKHPRNKVLIEKVEAALTRIKQRGDIEHLKKKWYPQVGFKACAEGTFGG